MRWDELSLNDIAWIIPAEKSKNHQPVYVHLVEAAKVILRRRLDEATRKHAEEDARYGEWVFPSKRFDAKTPHLMEAKSGWARILKGAKIRNLRVHDLRRTLGSYQAINNSSWPSSGRVLGTAMVRKRPRSMPGYNSIPCARV